MHKQTRAMKRQWRRACTMKVGEEDGRRRVRRPDAPSLKQWARDGDDRGAEWLQRKAGRDGMRM